MKKFALSVSLMIIGSLFSFAQAHDEACAQLCTKCSEMCTTNLAAFKKKGGKYAEPERLTLMEDCASICKMNADFKRRNSPFSADVDKLCSQACHKCAKKCEELKDSSLKSCIALCIECADSCDKHK